MNAESNETLPVSEKYMLTIKESAAYFNIGIELLNVATIIKMLNIIVEDYISE